ncbi:MAG TPA: hypothetical protein VF347_02440 [Candidatus Humimicrobiaceae bacterium]
MNDEIEENKYNKTSFESFVLGMLAIFSSIAFFLLVPGKSFGFNLIELIDPGVAFNKYVFFLFLILLLGMVAAGSSIIAIVFGIKDFKGIFRGAHIIKGKGIYLAGAAMGALSIIFLISFFIIIYLL